jgi:hypothetical protein
MAQAQVRHHVGVGKEGIGVEKTQRCRLHGSTQVKRTFLERGGQVGNDHFPDFTAGGAVEDEAEGALGVVLADEDDRPLKKGAVQLAAVQQQEALQELWRVRHNTRYRNFTQTRGAGNPDLILFIPKL